MGLTRRAFAQGALALTVGVLLPPEPDAETAFHVCKCPACRPGRFPLPEKRLGPAHLAVRFGHVWSPEDGYHLTVTVDGAQQRQCVEGLAGPRGWLYRHNTSRGLHVCSCGEGVCALFLRGHVEYVLVRGDREWRSARGDEFPS